jgi:bifunctional UDP-N-acetylglucosamine pyrophosphorylase / glucosamine-1-phosphate N-acetyltransferase
MRSTKHKVLHELAGRSMLWHVLTALREAGVPAERTTIVIGDAAAEVRAEVERRFPGVPYTFALQEIQLGTGHAALVAKPYVPHDAHTVVVAYGDTPLLQPSTIVALVERHEESGRPVTLVTGSLPPPQDLGRIVRDAAGEVCEIVEARDATPEQRAIPEVNSGFCAFSAPWIWEQIANVTPAANGEIYLTALASLAMRTGTGAGSLILEDVNETVGVNTRAQLADAERTLRGRINAALMADGVALQDPASTYVDAEVEVGRDTTIFANTHLIGSTRVGVECDLGPNAIVRDCVVGDRCRVLASMLDGAELEDDVSVGPFAHLRPGTHCGRGVEVGTGSEIKASNLGAGTKMHHFGYLGDAEVGSDVNIGAGAITCNFDGERKHTTRIGEGAFVGSGTLLIAPIEVGPDALTGAGAVVTRDVAPGAKVAGVPAKPIGERRAGTLRDSTTVPSRNGDARHPSSVNGTSDTKGEPHGDDTRTVA